jgi:hypothetical protein
MKRSPTILGCILDLDVIAELPEAVDEPAGELLVLPPVEVVGAEIAPGEVAAQHVVGGGEDRGGDGDDRLFRPAAAAEPMELGVRVALAAFDGGPGGLIWNDPSSLPAAWGEGQWRTETGTWPT